MNNMIDNKSKNSGLNRSSVEAKVVYEDINHHDQLVDQNVICGPVGIKVDFDHYKKKIPAHYEFVGYGNFNQRLVDGDVDVIYVKKRTDHSNNFQDHHSADPKSTIKIDYVDQRNQLISRQSFSGHLGEKFDLNSHARAVPVGYRFKKILVGNNVDTFGPDIQVVVVTLKKIKKSRITVEYICNGHQIDQKTIKEFVGKRFNLKPFLQKEMPSHYQFIKAAGAIPKKFQSYPVTVKILVKPLQSSLTTHKSSKSSILGSVSKPNLNTNQEINNTQKLGEVLTKIGQSLNSLGKLIQSQNRHN